MGEIKELLCGVVGVSSTKSVLQSKQRSYANVIKSPKKVVVINPTKPNQNSNEMRKTLKKKFNAKEFKMCAVSNSRKGGVVVECRTSAD